MSMIKRWMVQLGEWLIYMGSEPGTVTGSDNDYPEDDPLYDLACVLTAQQERNWPERDGECKRAAVYQQMTNSYPWRKKRDVSRAIEDALCGE